MFRLLNPFALAFIFALPSIAASQTPPAKSEPACATPRSIWLSAVEENGRPVDNLSTSDIVVQREKAKLTVLRLEQQRDQPLLLTLLIDTSASQEVPLVLIKKVANELLKSTLRPGKDQAEIFSFDTNLKLSQDRTNDLDKLSKAIERVSVIVPHGYIRSGTLVVGRPPNKSGPIPGSTTIWDSIYSVALASGYDQRRVIVIFTDGVDTGSKRKLKDAFHQAAIGSVAVFPVGIGDDQINGVNRDDLKQLAEKTGGQAYFPKKEEDVRRVVDDATRAIRSAYLLTYCSDGTTERSAKLKISVGDQVPDGRKLKLSYPRPSS